MAGTINSKNANFIMLPSPLMKKSNNQQIFFFLISNRLRIFLYSYFFHLFNYFYNAGVQQVL